MLKRFTLVILSLLVASVCYGAAIDNCVDGNFMKVATDSSSGRVLTTPPTQINVTSNTVSCSTVGLIVTFNSTIQKAVLINESTTDPIYVSFTGIGWDSAGTTYTLPTIAPPAFKLPASGSLSVDISTDKIGFITGTSYTGTTLNYLVTTNSETQP